MKFSFDRSLLSILLSDGLASGLYDPNGLMNMVSYDDTSFSQIEIDSSTYYNLHDFVTDFGLRFGLIPVVVIIYWLIKGFLKLST